MSEKSPTSPVRSTSLRLLEILKLIGRYDRLGGLRLVDVMALTSFDKSTVHRMLDCLTQQGFATRVAPGKRYRLGMAASQLALASDEHLAIKERLSPALLRIARRTGDVAYLMLRVGNNVVCLRREAGSFPIKTLLAGAGVVRPLGLSAAGVSMLSAMDESQLTQVLASNSREYELRGVQRQQLLDWVQAAKQRGYAEMPFLSNQVHGVGYAVNMAADVQVGIGVVAISARMAPPRRQEIGEMLQAELSPLKLAA